MDDHVAAVGRPGRWREVEDLGRRREVVRLLEHVDRRIFIARNRLDTMEHRQKRAREDFDPFIKEVLTTEHEIISQHRERADVVITRDYDVEFITV